MTKDKQPSWLVMPLAADFEMREADEDRLEAMLAEMGLEAPPQPVKPGLDQPPLTMAERYMLKLPVETNPFPEPPAPFEIFSTPDPDNAEQRDWFLRVEDAFGPATLLEMETAIDRSGSRHGARKGLFWLVGGGERVVYAWDGKRIVLAQPMPVEDGSSLIYDPDVDNLFIVSDAEERLYVFTMGRREKE